MPTRRAGQAYWSEAQFEAIRKAPAGKLQSRGPLPWRLLAFMLDASPEVQPIRELVAKRLMPPKRLDAAQKSLDHMLLTLWTAGYVTLEPRPPQPDAAESAAQVSATDDHSAYRAQFAHPTPELQKLLKLRGVNPLYGIFVINQLGIADTCERLQALESILEMPGTVARYVRVPGPDQLPPGPLAVGRLDERLLHLGLATLEELGAGEASEEEDERQFGMFAEEKVWPLALAEKLKRLFDYDFPRVTDVRITPVWAAGELLEFGGNFENFITAKRLQKQEGIVFRHLLRLVLLIGEFATLCPPDTDEQEWRGEMDQLRQRLIETCRTVDPTSVDEVLSHAEEELGPF